MTLIPGAYIEQDTPLHRVDARIKILLLLVFTGTIFGLATWWALALCGALVIAAWIAARIPAHSLSKALGPIALILVIMLFTNSLTTMSPDIPFVGEIGLSFAGLQRGVFFAVRIVLLIAASLVFTSTTQNVDMMDALSWLMSPLAKMGAPVEEFASMGQITLRFIPETAAEIERIALAQRARGAQLDSGGVLQRVRAWLPVLVPLIVALFRRAEELAIAMDSRCFQPRGRTKLTQQEPAPQHLVFAAMLALALILLAALG